MPPSLSEPIEDRTSTVPTDDWTEREERGLQSHGSQTSKQDLPNATATHQEEVTDPLAIIDDLAKLNSARQNDSSAARPLSSVSEPYGTGQENGVPKRLVPSASTERIMEILRERGLDIGVQYGGERKKPLNDSLEEVPEECYGSDREEVLQDQKDHISSSTPATNGEEHHRHHRSPRLEGWTSPHMFTMGSSPVHGSSQDLDRRASVNSLVSLPEGTYLGEACHKDGSLMSIVFQVGGDH